MLRLIIVRASDVPTYVQYGAAILVWQARMCWITRRNRADISRWSEHRALPHDGRGCAMNFDYESACARGARLRVATNTADRPGPIRRQSVHVDLIKLYGSMELAPLVGCRTRSWTW